MTRPRLVCLVGPTASGKSALALALAEQLGAEIVSADSRQVYRRLDVGTAKPGAAERARVRHHCLDLVEPEEPFDAARFRLAAADAITDIVHRGRVALVVGGTGLYLRALLRGLCPAPPRVPALRATLGQMIASRGAPAVHRGLAALDPAAAQRIGPHDAVRIVRALEVGLATGRRLSDWQAAHGFAETPYDALTIGLVRPVAELDARIAARARAMLAAGFLDEVGTLRNQGLGAQTPGLRAVGYPEMLAWLEGRCNGEEALAATVRATRRFAKRQRTWFRREREILWRHPEHDRERLAADVRAFLAAGVRPAPAAA
jgi:tRNA dimethylallyltransferase